MKKKIIFIMLFGALIGLSSFTPSGLITIKGLVVDAEEGYALPGVAIVVKGTTQGIATNLEGKFELKKVPDNAIIVIFMIGYQTVEIEAKKLKDGSTIKLKYIGESVTPNSIHYFVIRQRA